MRRLVLKVCVVQVAPVVPPRQHIGETAAQQPRPVHRILERERRDRREMRDKLSSLITLLLKLPAAA